MYPAPSAGAEPRRAAFLHRGVMRDMMIRLKYNGERHLAPVLAGMAVGEWDRVPGSGDALTVVPSSPSTLRKRGYNQARLIGRAVCGITGSSFTDLLNRKPGPSQVGLTARERRSNLRDVFRVVHRVPSGRIWLLDDVTATGETLSQTRRTLLQAGAGEVVLLAVNFRETGDGSMIAKREGLGMHSREDGSDSQIQV